MALINLDVTIGQRLHDSYPVLVNYPPEGTKSQTQAIAPAQPPLAPLLQWAANAVGLKNSSLRQVEALGAALYGSLFDGPAGELLRLALRNGQDEHGVRLRISSEDLDMLSVPWEFLYDPRAGRQFATDQSSPLVRFLSDFRTFGRPRSLRAELPLRMLMAVPAVPNLNVQSEIDRVREALTREGLGHEAIEVVVLDGRQASLSLQTLLDFLQEDAQGFDIFHFSGHGGTRDGRGILRFNDDNGGEQWIDAGTVARALKPYTQPRRRRRLRLALLNACLGGQSAPQGLGPRALLGAAPAFIQNDFAAVIAMQYEILDRAALLFARAFYRGLILGPTAGRVDLAVTEARNRLAAAFPGHRSFATPVLFVHTEDATIFQLKQPRLVEVTAATATGAVVQIPDNRTLLKRFAMRSPADLEAEIEHAQNLLRSGRGRLASLESQLGAESGLVRTDLERERDGEQENVQRLEQELAQLSAALVAARRLGVPGFVTIQQFHDGALPADIILRFMRLMPQDRTFTPGELVKRMAEEEPQYVRRIKAAELDDPDADHTRLVRRLGPRFDRAAASPESEYIRVSSKGRRRYRRSAYL